MTRSLFDERESIFAPGYGPKTKPMGPFRGLALQLLAKGIVALEIEDKSKLGTKKIVQNDLIVTLPEGVDEFGDIFPTFMTDFAYNGLDSVTVGNIPNGYNRTCPLPRLLVRQQTRVPVGRQVRQSGLFPVSRAQTAPSMVRNQP